MKIFEKKKSDLCLFCMFIIRLEHFKKYEYMATTIFMVKIKWCDSDYQTVLIQ